MFIQVHNSRAPINESYCWPVLYKICQFTHLKIGMMLEIVQISWYTEHESRYTIRRKCGILFGLQKLLALIFLIDAAKIIKNAKCLHVQIQPSKVSSNDL